MRDRKKNNFSLDKRKRWYRFEISNKIWVSISIYNQ